MLFCLGVGCASGPPAPDPVSQSEPAAALPKTVKSDSRAHTPETEAAPAQKSVPSSAAEIAKIEPAPAPKPAKSPWQKKLDRIASNEQLRQDAHYFPSLEWLSARWCRRGDTAEPALFYNIERTPTGFLNLIYGDRNGTGKRYNHVHIEGSFFDLWDEFGFGEYLKGEGGRRLEKKSDTEFALVYIFDEKPRTDRYDRQVFLDYTARRARETGRGDHLENPRVYVKCD